MSTTNYINNRQFFESIVVYKQKCKEAEAAGKPKPVLPQYIGECIMAIANKYANRPNFIGYSFKDEMIADGIRDCILYFDTFNTERGVNAFAYFTQTVHNAFIRRIQKERKQQYIKYKNMYREIDLTDVNNGLTIDTTVQDDFISDYEEKLKQKKIKKLAKDLT